ncbi:MAG: HTTM domain-containing protein [Fuerstiella sp.]
MTNVTEQAVSPLQLAGLKKKWNWFFFESADPANCAIIRIGYSALLLLMLLVQWPDAAFWYSDSGVLPLSASRKLIDSDTLTVLAWLPTDASTIQLCYGLFILQAVMLLVGFKSRLQAVCLLVWLTSFHHRNGLLLDGEDTVFRIFAFLLAFSPCSCRWSVDNWLHRRLCGQDMPVASGSAWALRLMQIQMTMIYASTAWEKLNGNAWLDGTALYYASRLDDVFGRLPVPGILFNSLTALKLMTWTVLVAEVLLPLGLWVRETRRAAILGGIALHLSIEWMMNLFLFEWIMIVGLLSFVTAADLCWLRQLCVSLIKLPQSQHPVRGPVISNLPAAKATQTGKSVAANTDQVAAGS